METLCDTYDFSDGESQTNTYVLVILQRYKLSAFQRQYNLYLSKINKFQRRIIMKNTELKKFSKQPTEVKLLYIGTVSFGAILALMGHLIG